MQKKTSLQDMISNSLDQVRTIIDADTVLGKELVTASGVSIIPISKVSIGFASGGLDLPAKGPNQPNFGGGGGTGVSVNPIGFLIVSPNGKVEIMHMTSDDQTPLEQVADFIDRTPEMLNRVKDVFNDTFEAESISSTLNRLENEYLGDMNLRKRRKLREKNK